MVEEEEDEPPPPAPEAQPKAKKPKAQPKKRVVVEEEEEDREARGDTVASVQIKSSADSNRFFMSSFCSLPTLVCNQGSTEAIE